MTSLVTVDSRIGTVKYAANVVLTVGSISEALVDGELLKEIESALSPGSSPAEKKAVIQSMLLRTLT